MWAVRRATNPLRGYGYSILACRSFSVCGDAFRSGNMQCFRSGERSQVKVDYEPVPERFFDRFTYTKIILGSRCLSSQAGPNAGGDEDQLEDVFSELESPHTGETESDSGDQAKELSGPELSEDEDSALNSVGKDADIELSEDEVGSDDEVKESWKRTIIPLAQLIIRSPAQSVKDAIDRWVEEGNTVNEDVVLEVMTNLRRRKFYRKALQFAEWLETKNAITLRDRDYAARVDLIAKVHGIDAAESYLKRIPPPMQNEVLYRTLLANSVYINSVKKSEQLFNLMRDKGFPLTAFSCNQLLLLYKRHDKKKLADVLLMMEKENVKPTLFTYKTLIDAKGQTRDYEGMEQVVENMKSEGILPDLRVQSIIARYYVSGKSTEKAEAILKEMEGESLKANRAACKELLPIYASLGKIDDVNRVWKLCEPSPRIEECIAVIEAWGKLGQIKHAEEVFDKMAKRGAKLPQRFYTSLLKVYAAHKQLAKGKDLVKRMLDDGCFIGPLTWDAIVKLYVQSGEVEKADSVLHKAVQQSRLKPLYSSYMTIMEKYSEKGDIHSAEKIFDRVRQAGYSGKRLLYQRLLHAYLKAKTPAYGIRERLKADNVFPDRTMAHLLSQVDWFKKSMVSELLE
ncbi:pentatricopeptide repeat-containing protein At1g80270, mitochondrial-like [Nymphaea colorata]|nr:pentatricopeptide repeat-containing protein At1g80270, mitochondrial-like [Nymphaea colorata]